MPRPLLLLISAALALLLLVPAASAATVSTTTAGADVDATVLVRVRGADRDQVHAAVGYGAVNRIEGIGVDVVRVPRDQIDAALDAYRSTPGVVFAERNRVVRLTAEPDDKFVDDQYALSRIRARGGWSDYGHLWRPTGGARLAIVDSGIDRFHSEFTGRVSHCRNWLTGLGIGLPGCQDSQFHGTHVAGIAAATANNRQGIAGVAFDSEIMALQAFNSAGAALTADIAAAIVYAARNGAKVANYSFGAATSSATERRAVEYAAARGVVQVAAAGNTGQSRQASARNVGYPARLKQVIAVSATDARDGLAAYSSRGPAVEVAAPGTRILSTVPGRLFYAKLSGTSMAAPHVAGLAALLREQGYTPWQTRKRIREGADDLGPSGRDSSFGYGRINMKRSVR